MNVNKVRSYKICPIASRYILTQGIGVRNFFSNDKISHDIDFHNIILWLWNITNKCKRMSL